MIKRIFFIITFIIILVVFLVAWAVNAQALESTSTWTTKGDFENNAVTTGGPTVQTNVLISGSGAGDDSDVTMDDPAETSSISSLKIDCLTSTKWINLSYNATIPANTSIQFRVRSADSEEDLEFENWQTVFQATNNLIAIAKISRWLEIEVQLINTDDISTATLEDFALTYETQSIPTEECSNCHSAYPYDQFDQYLETANVTYDSCVCHQNLVAGWNVHTSATYDTPYGKFKNAGSLTSSASVLHSKHIDEHLTGGYDACSGCHHNGGEGCAELCHWFVGQSDCRSCHYTADCSSCHEDTVPHQDHGNVTPRNSYIADGSSYGAQDVTCFNTECHNPTFVAPPADGSLELTPLCPSCHYQDISERTITTIGKTGHGSDIEGLHNSGIVSDPDSSNPINKYCTDCHTSSIDTEHTTRTTSSTGELMTCDSCHRFSQINGDTTGDISTAVISKDAVKTAIRQDDPDCSSCHVLHDSRTSAHNYSSLGNSCRDCHSTNISTGHINKGLNCTTCHDYNGSALDKDMVDGAIVEGSVKCDSCHENGEDPHYDADSLHNITLDSDCRICHNRSLSYEHEYRDVSCTECHTEKDASPHTADSCSDCHENDHDLEGIHQSTARTSCFTCHEKDLRTEHEKRDKACTVCHEPTSNATYSSASVSDKVKTAVENGNTDCFACHTEGHPFNYNDCQVCHGSSWSCSNCHTLKQNHKNRVGCTECHTNAFGIHHENETMAVANCVSCHNADHSYSSSTSSCHQCHPGVEHKKDFSFAANLIPAKQGKSNIKIGRLDPNNAPIPEDKAPGQKKRKPFPKQEIALIGLILLLLALLVFGFVAKRK